MDVKELEERIERLRHQLMTIAKEKDSLHDMGVVALSQKLDQLIVLRQQMAAGAKE